MKPWEILLIVVAGGFVFFNYTDVGKNLSNQFLNRTGVSLGSGTVGQPGGHPGLF